MATTILVIYAAMSVLTLAVLGFDKRRAVRGRSRVPEATLHLLELLGGWPGSLIGQHLFRHKNRKLSYQLVFWLIVAGHAAGWVALWCRFLLEGALATGAILTRAASLP